MAKLVKKRRDMFLVRCTAVFTFAMMIWLFSCIVIASYNTNLTIDIQKIENEVELMKAENQQLNIDIQTLQNKDRVYTIASNSGLTQSQDNIISVSQGDTSEEE